VGNFLADPKRILNQGIISLDEEDPLGQLADSARLDAAVHLLQLSEDQLDAILEVREVLAGLTHRKCHRSRQGVCILCLSEACRSFSTYAAGSEGFVVHMYARHGLTYLPSRDGRRCLTMDHFAVDSPG
jgi:hypothetical protein